MPEPLRLALVRQRYTAFGGAEQFVARAMQVLQNQGATVSLLTRQWQTGATEAVVCNPFYLGTVWRDWGFARCVCRALAQRQFDLVQSHERIACCDIYRAGDGVHREWLKQRARSLPYWRRLGIAFNPYHRYTLAAERKLFGAARLKAVICNSRMVQQEIRDYFDVPEEKLHLIYSGVDLSLFHPRSQTLHRSAIRERLGINADTPVFLFVGSGFARKGVAPLLHGLTAVPDAQLIVVGHDKHATRYQRLARQLGLSQRTHFVGAQKELPPFYGAADALVLPTLYDPFPNVALEALGCGLPVLTSYKSGAAELIVNGQNGYVCDALDIPALQKRLALMTPAHMQQMRLAARASVEHLSLDAMAVELTRLYHTLLS